MAEYKLQKDDFVFIKEILKNSEDIRNVYSLLSLLEKENKKSHPDYRMSLARLSKYLMVEQTLYDSLDNDTERMQAIMEFLIINDQINNFDLDLKVVVDGDKSEQVKRRIINNINLRKINNDVIKLYEMASSFDKENNMKLPNHYYVLAGSIEYITKIKEDYLSSLLLLGKDNIDLKYKLSYVFNFCEKKMLADKFEVREKLYWYSDMYAELNEMPDSMTIPSKKIFGIPLYEGFLSYQKNSKRKEEWDILKRVSLLYMNDEEVEKVEKDDLLKELHKKDKEKPNITSFIKR